MAERTCTIANCEKPARSKGPCSMHQARIDRHGSPDIVLTDRTPKVYQQTHGYLVVTHMADHPLADSHGNVYEHRLVLFGRIGAGPHKCHWCDVVLPWDDLTVDHLNEIKSDNRPQNLVPACGPCNSARSHYKLKWTQCPNGHEYTSESTAITPQGHRRCRVCRRATQARYERRQA